MRSTLVLKFVPIKFHGVNKNGDRPGRFPNRSGRRLFQVRIWNPQLVTDDKSSIRPTVRKPNGIFRLVVILGVAEVKWRPLGFGFPNLHDRHPYSSSLYDGLPSQLLAETTEVYAG